jgi:acetyl-CoA carboxylase biotin carboxyl carrier protein
MSEPEEAARKENNETPQPSTENRPRRDNRRNRKPQRAQTQRPEASLNMNELRELADLISQHGFTDFEFENESIRVRLKKELAPQIIQAAAPAAYAQPAAAQTATAAAQPSPAATAAETKAEAAVTEDEGLHKITSPIVGTFYRTPSPEADSFVKIGSKVSADTIVCIVEAMKLMNEIPAEVSGEIVKIYVENGQPVEYGQALFGVKK